MPLNKCPADPITHALTILGTLPVEGKTEPAQAIVRIEKTALIGDQADQLFPGQLKDTKLIDGTDIVSSYEDRERPCASTH